MQDLHMNMSNVVVQARDTVERIMTTLNQTFVRTLEGEESSFENRMEKVEVCESVSLWQSIAFLSHDRNTSQDVMQRLRAVDGAQELQSIAESVQRAQRTVKQLEGEPERQPHLTLQGRLCSKR